MVRRRLAAVVAMTILISGLVAGPALGAGRAPDSRVTAVCTSPAPVISGIARAWDAGRTSHVRGWTASYDATGDPLCAGTVEVVAGIEMSAGIAGLRGTVVYRLSGIDGGWTGRFEQTWAFDQGLLTYGREVATGFGELAGWQLRATLSEAFDGTITEIDEVFVPGG
jgi:hypothetical protein